MEYVETVIVKVYFDDVVSTLSRLGMYQAASIGKVAFWRLGQEDPAVWSRLAILSGPPAPLGLPVDVPAAAVEASMPVAEPGKPAGGQPR